MGRREQRLGRAEQLASAAWLAAAGGDLGQPGERERHACAAVNLLPGTQRLGEQYSGRRRCRLRLFEAGVQQEQGQVQRIFAVLAQELNSHRQLPQAWYQFQTKFRDEPRPRAGLLRVREFTMKDSYTFDLDAAGLDAAFDRHRAAYLRIFERLGIPVIPVEASSGAMGGRDSTEFMCPSDAGEDTIAHCPACNYAANVEKATSALPEIADGPGLPAPERFDTPSVRTIEDLAAGYDAPAERQIKTLVYLLDGRAGGAAGQPGRGRGRRSAGDRG